MFLRRSIATALNLEEVWVGIDDRFQEGNWTWIDGSQGLDSEIVWVRNQPDNYGSGEDCGELWPYEHEYKMNDEPCQRRNRGLCEKRFPL